METGNRKKSKAAPSTKAGSKAAPASTVNWAGVKKAYCGSQDSTRAIGAAFAVSHTMVAKMAAKEGWVRPPKPNVLKRKPYPRPTTRKKTGAPVALSATKARQERFVAEYLLDQNGTQAYIRTVPGTPERTAQTMASRLLGKVEVQGAIAAGRKRTVDRLELTRDRVMAEYARLAFFDMRQAYHDSGALKMPHELDEDTAAAIAAYETVEMDGGGKDAPPLQVRKVKWADKRAALDSIMKAQGWNKSDVGTAENPLVIRDMTDAERAVRISAALQAHPGLAALFAQFVPGGSRQ